MVTSTPFTPPTKFSFQPEDWEWWKEEFLTYHMAARIHNSSDEVQVASILYAMGVRQAKSILVGQRLHETEVTVGTGAEQRNVKKINHWESVLAALDKHFQKTPNIRHERSLFHVRVQQAGESALKYYEAPIDLAKTCSFSNVEDAVLDRFIIGLNNSDLRLKLQVMEGLTLEKALDHGFSTFLAILSPFSIEKKKDRPPLSGK